MVELCVTRCSNAFTVQHRVCAATHDRTALTHISNVPNVTAGRIVQVRVCVHYALSMRYVQL